MDANKPRVYFVLGGPGAGKGTQCSLLVEKNKFVHLSAGELLREERDRKTQYGELIEEIMMKGQIVPSHITVNLLYQAMEKNGLNNNFLIDGFPRNQENLETWLKEMGEKVEFKSLLFFECLDNIMKERIKARSQQSGRTDDNDETLMKRIEVYNTQTKPIIEYFEKQGKSIKISAGGSVEQVNKEILEKLGL